MNTPPELRIKFQPLFQGILGYLHQTHDTPLRFEIDSAGIVTAALKEFRSSLNKDDWACLSDGETVGIVFDALVKQTLHDEWGRHETANMLPVVKHAFPVSNPGNDSSNRVVERMIADGASHPLTLWLRRFFTTARDVHPLAVEIVILRTDGLTNREIAERFGLGLRLVHQIIMDVKEALDKKEIR